MLLRHSVWDFEIQNKTFKTCTFHWNFLEPCPLTISGRSLWVPCAATFTTKIGRIVFSKNNITMVSFPRAHLNFSHQGNSLFNMEGRIQARFIFTTTAAWKLCLFRTARLRGPSRVFMSSTWLMELPPLSLAFIFSPSCRFTLHTKSHLFHMFGETVSDAVSRSLRAVSFTHFMITDLIFARLQMSFSEYLHLFFCRSIFWPFCFSFFSWPVLERKRTAQHSAAFQIHYDCGDVTKLYKRAGHKLCKLVWLKSQAASLENIPSIYK